MTSPKVIQDYIKNCKKCVVVDKPPSIFRIYERYVPKPLKTLVISESPPPGRKKNYIYNLGEGDRLRRVLAKVFEVPEENVIDFLMRQGIFWSTAIKCRPISKSKLEEMRRKCVEVLKLELSILKPRRVVALGKVAIKSISEVPLAGIKVIEYYHPLYVVRFRRSELTVLRKVLLGRE